VNRRTIGTWLLVSLLLGGCASAPLKGIDTLPDYALRVSTEDGWELSLFRRPAQGDGAAGLPILLVPSVGMNRRAFTSVGSDFAEFLAGQGFDVWIFESRGSVSSQPPDRAVWRRAEWNVNDLLTQDVPAAVDAILKATGRDSVFWLGHGLGAHLGARYAEVRPEQIAGLIALGLGGDCDFPTRFQRRFASPSGLVPPSGKLAFRNLGRVLAPTLHPAPDLNGLHALFNEANLSIEVVASLAANGLEDIGVSVAEELQAWCGAAAPVPQFFGDDFTRLETPVLFLAGGVDPIAPAWAVRTAWESWGALDKELVILGEGWGQAYDYGHLDLILGDGLRDEVFPVIGDWLAARAESVPPPDRSLRQAPSEAAEKEDAAFQGGSAFEAGAEP